MRASTRADNIINGRQHQAKRKARVTGGRQSLGRSPRPLVVEKSEAATLFLQKAVRSIQSSTLFGELSEGHLDHLVRAMHRVELQPFDLVIRQGDTDADCCYVCGEGCEL